MLTKKEPIMPQPFQDVDTLFEELLQDLPPETVARAHGFKAFSRARKIKMPAQLLGVVRLYCGLDKSRREVASHFTLLVERITDSAVAERLAACRPGCGRCWCVCCQAQRRMLVLDGSGIQAPGARGTQYRLHRCMELVTLTGVAQACRSVSAQLSWRCCQIITHAS